MSTFAKLSERQRTILLIGGCGYIGSYLYPRLQSAGFQVTVCDQLERGNPSATPVLAQDYSTLTSEELQQYGVVLWFAGHSSVAQSISDPSGAIENNCLKLFSMAKKLASETRLIYASTGSLYSTSDALPAAAAENSIAQIPSQNPYDMSKFAFDYLAQNFLSNVCTLRMGTLAGYSPGLRSELVFNAMNISAFRHGNIKIRNGHAWRTLLFLDDLWALVFSLLCHPSQIGIFNVGSLSLRIEDLAKQIASTWGASILREPDTATYSFNLNTYRMQSLCGSLMQRVSIEERCRQFIAEVCASQNQSTHAPSFT